MKHQKFLEDNKCLSCPDTVEDTVHVLLCPHQPASQDRVYAWEEAVEGFKAWMTEAHMEPDIHNCFSIALRARTPTTSYTSDTTIDAATDQGIGWDHLLCGGQGCKDVV